MDGWMGEGSWVGGRRWGWIGGWGLRGRVAVGMVGDQCRCSAPRWMTPRHVALGCVRLRQAASSASSFSPRTPAHNVLEKMIPYQPADSVPIMGGGGQG